MGMASTHNTQAYTTCMHGQWLSVSDIQRRIKGLGVFGQLGHGNSRDLLQPKAIEAFLEPNVIQIESIATGSHHSVAIDGVYTKPTHTSHTHDQWLFGCCGSD
jgi:alpha-tubulin suppressor-like RCC1 family protein